MRDKPKFFLAYILYLVILNFLFLKKISGAAFNPKASFVCCRENPDLHPPQEIPAATQAGNFFKCSAVCLLFVIYYIFIAKLFIMF